MNAQRLATELSARLAQVAKDPPDLASYLRVHAECIAQGLQPVGMAYEMASGQNFQRAFSFNYDSLKLRETPEQESVFQRALRTTLERNTPLFLDTTPRPADGLDLLRSEDAETAATQPLVNRTPFQQVFAPIPVSKKAIGVIHAWFEPTDAQTARARLAVTAHAASEIELYLKARRSGDVGGELARLNTYARFLEDVAGDQDLESVAWTLVNYAREAVGCERVCLLVNSKYGLARDAALPEAGELLLQACSGLRRPHARSEQSGVLRDHASELLKLAVPPAAAAKPDDKPKEERKPGEAAATEAEEGANGADKDAKPGLKSPPGEKRPQMRIIFTHRDPSKVDSRPAAVNRYFEEIPMNWSTVLPLFDRENRVCGTLLFEGLQWNEGANKLFTQMRDLAVSGGRATATALVWQRRRTLRMARWAMRLRDRMMATTRRQWVLKYALPLALLIGLLAFPFPYRVKGEAMLRPTNVQSVAVLTTGRLTEVLVTEGARVTAGQVLCTLDSSDLQLQLRQVEQERERALSEASYALGQQRSEAQMQIARLNAEKAATVAEKLRRDIEATVIRAPFDGILIGPQNLSQRRGEVIRAGETVAEIVDPTHWEVKVAVREKDLPTLERQAPPGSGGVDGEVVLAANPDQRYRIHLVDASAFSHRLDLTGGNYGFSATLPVLDQVETAQADDLSLKAGYTGRVSFHCGRRPLVQILFGDFVRFLKLNLF